MATILLLLLIFSPFAVWIEKEEPSMWGRIFVIAIIFFTAIYVANRLISQWLKRHKRQ